MTKKRGRALIINNEEFPNCQKRLGSDVDVGNLKEMLETFKFTTEVRENISSEVLKLMYITKQFL